MIREWGAWAGAAVYVCATSADGRNGPLTIALGVSGDLAPRQEAGAVVLKSGEGPVLRYAGLTASDARGQTLPSRLEVRGREIRLNVEDRAAQYPVVVDPTWSNTFQLGFDVDSN